MGESLLAGLWLVSGRLDMPTGYCQEVRVRGTVKRYCQEVLLRGTVRRYGEEVRLEVWLGGTVKRYG